MNAPRRSTELLRARRRAGSAMVARQAHSRLLAEHGLATLLRLQRAGYQPRPGEPDVAALYLQALARLDAAAAAAILSCLDDAHRKE